MTLPAQSRAESLGGEPASTSIVAASSAQQQRPAGVKGTAPASAEVQIPRLPTRQDHVDARALHAVRAFHFGIAGQREHPLSIPMIPALIWPYRDVGRVRTTYPLLLFPPTEEQGRVLLPLAEALEELVPAGARILRDNLLRIEREARAQLSADAMPVPAPALLKQVGDSVASQLGLAADSAARLGEDIEALVAALPPESRLLGYHDRADLCLLQHTAMHRQRARRQEFRDHVSRLASRLRELLSIEAQKSPESRGAGALGRAMGPTAGRFVDPAALASIIGDHRGSERMNPERRQRIERVLETFERHLAGEPPLLCLFNDGPPLPKGVADISGCEASDVPDATQAAAERFEEIAAQYTSLFRAVRIAKLELRTPKGDYDPVEHDPWFASFHWKVFSPDELLVLPSVVAITTEDHLAEGGMTNVSRLLRSGRPVKVLTRVHPAKRPGKSLSTTIIAPDALVPHTIAASDDPPPAQVDGIRFEIGYLGISHREALVWQSAAALPDHLVRGFRRGLDCARPCLYVVASGEAIDGQPSPVGPQLHTAAAVESRAHPLFGFDPEAGQSWARRFDLASNPALQLEWSEAALTCSSADGHAVEQRLSFTYADFALLDPRYQRCFCLVPETCAASEALLPVADYLALDVHDASKHIPFIWAVDPEGTLRRLVLSRPMTVACRDRLGFWLTLQELAGIRSEYVERAAYQAKEEAEARAAARIEALERMHAEELERVRNAAAAEAMGRLAQALTQVDLSGIAQASPLEPTAAPAAVASRTTVVAPTAVAPEAPSAPVPVENHSVAQAAPQTEPDDFAFDDPWIDGPLCTSCNDCIAVNSRLFGYNENKQAQILDPHAGSYAELVRAAEKCPARCIHPGQPLDPDEPNLEELIARAKPFNRMS